MNITHCSTQQCNNNYANEIVQSVWEVYIGNQIFFLDCGAFMLMFILTKHWFILPKREGICQGGGHWDWTTVDLVREWFPTMDTTPEGSAVSPWTFLMYLKIPESKFCREVRGVWLPILFPGLNDKTTEPLMKPVNVLRVPQLQKIFGTSISWWQLVALLDPLLEDPSSPCCTPLGVDALFPFWNFGHRIFG